MLNKAMTVLFLLMSYNVMADVDECVDKKILSFRSVMGENAPLSHDTLEEWEYECKMGGYTDYVDPGETTENRNPEISVSIKHESEQVGAGTYENTFIRVQSKEDSIVLEEVIVNRGNCPTSKKIIMGYYTHDLPYTLKFGESGLVHIHRKCNIAEIKVVVNQNELIYNVD